MKAIEGVVALTPNEVRLMRALLRPDAISTQPEPKVEVAIMRESGSRYIRIQRGDDFIEIKAAVDDDN